MFGLSPSPFDRNGRGRRPLQAIAICAGSRRLPKPLVRRSSGRLSGDLGLLIGRYSRHVLGERWIRRSLPLGLVLSKERVIDVIYRPGLHA